MEGTPGPVLGPGEGEMVQVFSLGVRFMIEGGVSGGRFTLVEHPLAPRALGSPVHTHRNEDEYSYILEGRIGIQLGDEVLQATAGDLVFKPRGIPHAFWNAGDEPARLLEVISPAGFENYFREVAALVAMRPPNTRAIGEVAARYGLELDMGSVPILAQKHGLRLD